MKDLRNLKWVIFDGEKSTDTLLAESISKEHLLANLKSGAYEVPTIKPGQELCLVYATHGLDVMITVCDQACSVIESRYEYPTYAEIVLESVKADKCYVRDYHNERMLEEAKGVLLDTYTYLEQLKLSK